MTQKTSEQPSKIVLLAPIAIVLAVYSFGFFTPQQSKLRSTQTRHKSLAEAHHETEHEINHVRIQSARIKSEMRELTSELDELQQVRAELLTRRKQMRHQLESHALPAATMERVTRLMESHRLFVIESQPDSGAANQVQKVLKSVRDLLQEEKSPAKPKFAAHHHTHPPHHTHATTAPHHTHFAREVYKLKVRGRFQDLQAALETLAAQLEHVLPLSLQMEPMELDSAAARQSQRIWTLTIMV